MENVKPVNISLMNHFKLSKSSCTSSKKDIEGMEVVPYSLVVGSFTYAIVYTRPNIVHDVCIVSIFLSNPRKDHWE